MDIQIVLPNASCRQWHLNLVERLRLSGHRLRIQRVETDTDPLCFGLITFFENKVLRRKPSLLDKVFLEVAEFSSRPDLSIDFTGSVGPQEYPVLCVECEGSPFLGDIASQLAKGELPTVRVYLNDVLLETAYPMIDNRLLLSRGVEDVLARTVSLVVKCVRKVARGAASTSSFYRRKGRPAGSQNIGGNYVTRMLPNLIKFACRRLFRHPHSHWHVGFRFNDGPGVAETQDLSGTGWSVIPDRRGRFYADPFPFEWQGKTYIFVEDYIYAKSKGIVSVSEVFADGTVTAPEPVLEEEHHLSYPNVFAWDGDIWMLPESGATGQLTLYKAVDFPRRWQAHKILLRGREVADATLLYQDDVFWMFVAERDGAGSAADMMSVFCSSSLDGEWTPHPENPVVIDRAGARPGGNIIRSGNRLFLPVQDGTKRYGGGLSLREILKIDKDNVVIGEIFRIDPRGDWPYPEIHSLNRLGRLEVIDGIVR